MRRYAIAWTALSASLLAAHGLAQAAREPARPVEPIAALIDAFRTSDIVAIKPDAQVQALLLALIRDPRFATVANDIVVEHASARYQDVLDRFVRGDSDLSVWQVQTVVSLLVQDPRVRIFTVLLKGGAVPDAFASWPVPSLAIIEGTDLGARDFAEYAGEWGAVRVSVRDEVQNLKQACGLP